ncbi:hypothetical protein HDU83_002610 [Entophlyctis luteolus]|nr:hypothetical protein HDU83_002610 [Entophlyctis luteolus]
MAAAPVSLGHAMGSVVAMAPATTAGLSCAAASPIDLTAFVSRSRSATPPVVAGPASGAAPCVCGLCAGKKAGAAAACALEKRAASSESENSGVTHTQTWTLQLPSPSNASSNLAPSFLPNKSSADRLVPSPVTSGNNPHQPFCMFSPTFSNAPPIVQSPKAIPRKRTPSISAFTTISSLSSSLELSLVLSNQAGIGGGSVSNDSYLEKEFCKDFLCCDTVLSDLHELNQHIQQFHPELNPTAFSTASAMNLLDSLILHQFMPTAEYSNLPDTIGSTAALSPPNRDVSDASPKTSFYTPPTSLSPEMSPRTNTDSTLMSQMLMDFDDELPPGQPFVFSDESDFVAKINQQQHQPFRFQQSRRDSADTVNVVCDDGSTVLGAAKERPQADGVDSLLAFEEADGDVDSSGVFEGSAVGMDILERLERMGMHQQLTADDELEKSLTMILLQSDDGPLLNSGTVESRSPPAVPLMRFGPHHEDITTASSIALAEIYRQVDESETASASSNAKVSLGPTTIPSIVLPVQMFQFEESEKEASDSDAETSYSRDSMDDVSSFQIDLAKDWDLTGASNLFDNPARMPTAAAAATKTTTTSARAQPAARRTLSMPMLSKLNKIKAGNAGVLGPSSTSSACISKHSGSKPPARSTKKMRVAGTAAASRTLLDVETAASIITASSPILTPPHRTSAAAASAWGAASRKAPMRRASFGSSVVSSEPIDSDEQVAAAAGVAVCTTSALSASIAASRRAAAAAAMIGVAADNEDASIASSSTAGAANEDDEEDDAADVFVFPKSRRSAAAAAASATAAAALGTNSRSRKILRSVTVPAALTTPKATPTAALKVRKTANGLAGVKEHMELDPAFARKFKSRTVAEQAALTLEALRDGDTLADVVIKRLPSVKPGEERRLKLGSLSILDPHTLDKRFFCPYHLNHSHVEPNELPAGYYFGKKKKEAEDMSKPFVCTVRKCGKRYKNLNGLKYHIEHGHVLSAHAKGDGDPDASGPSDESEEESDDS